MDLRGRRGSCCGSDYLRIPTMRERGWLLVWTTSPQRCRVGAVGFAIRGQNCADKVFDCTTVPAGKHSRGCGRTRTERRLQPWQQMVSQPRREHGEFDLVLRVTIIRYFE